MNLKIFIIYFSNMIVMRIYITSLHSLALADYSSVLSNSIDQCRYKVVVGSRRPIQLNDT
jgi:hypothetical protein